MMDSRDAGDQIMKRRPATRAARSPRADEFVHMPATTRVGSPLPDTHVAAGNVLWTLAHNGSMAQARRWITPLGYELELQIWTGPRVEGQEDLCWSQLFGTEEALAEAALAKKRQLEASGWLEDLDTSAR